MQYVKDSINEVFFVRPYSGQFGRLSETVISLINSCRYVHRKGGHEYTYMATGFDFDRGVIFYSQVFNL